MVFDSAAVLSGKYLNTLITGPSLINDLLTTLIKLRESAIVVTSDIEAMSNRIQMTEEDAVPPFPEETARIRRYHHVPNS